MKLKVIDIAKMINGKINGDPNIFISSFANIKNAQKGDVTFLANKKYEKYIKSTKASLIIIPNVKIETPKTTISVDDPVTKFSEILNLLKPKHNNNNGVALTSKISASSKIGNNTTIDDFCVIQNNAIIGDNCVIGSNTFIGYNVVIKSNCQIGPNVTIYHNSEIGKDCVVHAGAIIGSDGFGFVPHKEKLSKMPQVGKVIVKNNVEIGANTTIDRGTLENTQIGKGVKLDNLIQIGHNVQIGENTVIAAQSGIAGSTKIGKNCMIGGQVAIANHIKIGNNVKIAGKSGVIKNIPNNKIIQGPLAFDIKEFQKSYIHFKNLTKIVEELNQLKKRGSVSKNNKK